MRRERLFLPLLAALFGVVAGACSQDVAPIDPRNIDRPIEMAFGCFGDHLRADGEIVREAQPLQNCVSGQTIEGDAGVALTPSLFSFVLQGENGTVALVNMSIPGDQAGVVVDSDPLVPGKNAIPVGTLPVSIVADAAGCQMVVANSGTCDLSVMEVQEAVEQRASVVRHSVVNASGDVIAAEPRAMVAEQLDVAVDQECPADPVGLLYVAYPSCHLVAVVDPSDGYQVVAGIRFPEDGPPEITDGAVTCPVECGGAEVATALPAIDGGMPDGGAPDAGAPAPDAAVEPPVDTGGARPVALELAPDGAALYIGADNAAMVAVVELDADRLPTSVTPIALEGDVGVTRLAATGPLEMGGSLGTSSFGQRNVGVFSFVYAIASDRSIRVVEVDDKVECDTQIDPRYVHDDTSAGDFACFAVGSVFTPPRRAGARGPGIRMPRDAIPLDVVTFDVNTFGNASDLSQTITASTPRAPAVMVGHFAMVTTSDGFAHVITIDDDHYPDFEDKDDPGAVDLPLAMAHQLRDGIQRVSGDNLVGRNERPTTCDVDSNAGLDTGEANVRAQGGLFRVFHNDYMVGARGGMVPGGRNVVCNIPDSLGLKRALVSELDWGAPIDVHELAFPDVAVAHNEEFYVIWEGRLSLDDPALVKDGPPVRVGVAMKDGNEIQIIDGGGAFCELGAQPYDVLQLLGCQADSNCSVGEECVFHADSKVNTGLCLPSDQADALLGRCRDLLISNKRYTIQETYAGHVTLGVRRRVLRTTPIDGCTDDTQCTEAARYEPFLRSDDQPYTDNVAAPPDGFDQPYTFACVDDPTRAPGPKKCLMTCDADADCEDGYSCSAGFCIEAPLPPIDCMQALQRYDVRAGEAFSVVGAALNSARITGFLHNRIADPATGECVADPDGNPLSTGRIPLRVPDCTGDGLADVTPNPCMTTVDHVPPVVYEFANGQCKEVEPGTDDDDLPVYEPIEVPAIRFRNPVMTMHLVNVRTTGDLNCFGDKQLGLAPFSPVYPGFQITIRIAGGTTPFFAPINTRNIEAVFPIAIQKGPFGLLWVLDEGDLTSSTLGQIIRVDPDQANNNFGITSTFAVIR